MTRQSNRWRVSTTGDAREIDARDVLFATNGYTDGAAPALQRRFVPIGSYIIATEPLSAGQATALLPRRRVAFDSKNFLYYFRVTADRRLLFGGRAEFARAPTRTRRAAPPAILRTGMTAIFPELASVRIDYAWGGNVAFTRDQMPRAGTLDGLFYAGGYCGHGVAMATYLGEQIARRMAGEPIESPALRRSLSPRSRCIPATPGSFRWLARTIKCRTGCSESRVLGGEMRAMADAVVARCVDHIATLDRQPSCGDVDAAALCRAMREPRTRNRRRRSSRCSTPSSATGFHDRSPRRDPGYLAYIPGGGLYPAALADFIANTTNRYTGVWQAAPALVQLEANALDWLRDWMGFPPGTRGLFTTGGSMATFNAIICARERHLGAEIRRGVLYTSDQAHHSVLKSAKLAGVMPDRVRAIESDGRFRLNIDALHQAIAAGPACGPHAVRRRLQRRHDEHGRRGSAGRHRRRVCRRGDVAPHRRRFTGAFFYLCDDLHATLRGLPRADSLTLDPHKGMFLPYGTGALLVRDGRDAAGGARSDRCVSSGDAASRGLLRSQPARAGAVARVSRPPRVAVGEAVWCGGVS